MLTTTALYCSSFEWFGACSWKPTPKGLPSSLVQLMHKVLVHLELLCAPAAHFQFANSSDRGSVAILIIGPKNMDTEYAQEIDTLLQGFSFDGEACKGPSGLRKAKSIIDNLCDRGIINAS